MLLETAYNDTYYTPVSDRDENEVVQLPTPQQSPQPYYALPLPPPPSSLNINWDKVASLFRDPRATPAFYKVALNLLVDLLGHQRAMEQLAYQKYRDTLAAELQNRRFYDELGFQKQKFYDDLGFRKQQAEREEALKREQLDIQRQMATTRDLSPLVNIANSIESKLIKLYEAYATMPDKKSPQAIKMANDITQLEAFRDQLYTQLAKHYGLTPPKLSGYEKIQAVQTPEQGVTRNRGSVLSFAIPYETFAPEEYVFVRPLKTVFGGGLKEVFEPELTFFGLR